MKVDIDEIAGYMDVSNDEMYFYFNKADYKIYIYNEFDKEISEIEEDNLLDDKFIKLPKTNEYKIMKEFAIQENSKDLWDVLHRKKAYKNFKDMVYKIGLSKKWYEFREKKLKETAKSWCEYNNLLYKEKLF